MTGEMSEREISPACAGVVKVSEARGMRLLPPISWHAAAAARPDRRSEELPSPYPGMVLTSFYGRCPDPDSPARRFPLAPMSVRPLPTWRSLSAATSAVVIGEHRNQECGPPNRVRDGQVP
jgi:hypothetical protein